MVAILICASLLENKEFSRKVWQDRRASEKGPLGGDQEAAGHWALHSTCRNPLQVQVSALMS